jgi:adenylate cyclase
VALLRRAIEIDPDYALALVWLAYCQFIMVSQHLADHSPREIAERALAAVQLDGRDPEVLHRAGYLIALSGGDMAGGIAIANKSIELNPNSAMALQTVGSLYAFAGDKQKAITCLERSMRLNPLDRSLDFYLGHALAHFVAGEYEATIEWTGEALREVPNHVASLRYRAASLGLLGRPEEGRQVVQRLLAMVPDFTITRARRFIEFEVNNVFKTPGVADALYEGLRRCGVPE